MDRRPDQGHLFGWLPPAAKAGDPESARTAALNLERSGRRESAGERILRRLRRGPVSNLELARITLRYGARIYDLRRQGYVIETEARGESGITLYVLKGPRPHDHP